MSLTEDLYAPDRADRKLEYGTAEPEFRSPLAEIRRGNRIAAAYADGGVIRINPSPIGGTWAWCHVDADGNRIVQRGGVILPADIQREVVTNNVTEFAALARCVRALPDGWSGKVYSDSKIALGWLFWGYRCDTLPEGWLEVAHRNLRRLGRIEAVLLDGHPTRAQLAAGIGKRGNPCSEHNVWCDAECGRMAAAFQKREAEVTDAG